MYGSNNELIRFGPWGAGLPEPAKKVMDEFFLNFIAGSPEVIDPLIQHAICLSVKDSPALDTHAC